MTMNSLVEKHPLREKRKANKPLLERKRRARINDCLAELKNLVLTSLNKDISRFNKMEKADVLDMTVQYLKACKMRKANEDSAVSFRAGFNECASEIIHYIMTLDDVDRVTKAKLLSYLATSCKLAESTQNQTFFSGQSRSSQSITATSPLSPCQSPNQIIPSPTSSGSREANSPSAFSPLFSLIPRSPNEKTTFVLKPVPVQTPHSGHHTQIAPKMSSNPRDLTVAVPSSFTVKPKVWRPW
ncbi:transcription factor HES-2-like [Rhopilema esculentum]|uniref:transcription factor HES-2-like n=1 Tax=Rhopilema esculentum TaxID=499914 RepID=UPI0031DFAA70|eukprot:gene6384-11823_t